MSFVKSIEETMVLVKGGTFLMGNDDTFGLEDMKLEPSETREEFIPDSYPAHKVTLSDFYIGKYTVTQQLWNEVMGENQSIFQGDTLPVTSVTYDDVQAFIQKINESTGLNYRLPTEAEWEFAARGGNNSKGFLYSGSENVDDVAWHTENSGDTTHPVGLKQPNELGIYDMSGNVYEWCSDFYKSDYYAESPEINPTGPAEKSKRFTTYVLRGGGYGDNEFFCRVDFRVPLDKAVEYFGFRLARNA